MTALNRLLVALALSLGTVAAEEQSFTRTFRDTYRLQPAFAEHFAGTADEALTTLRFELAAAGVEIPEGTKIEVGAGKQTLTLEHDGRRGSSERAKLADHLAKAGWWKRPARETAVATQRAAEEQSKPWIDAILQMDDSARRAKALDEVKAALAATEAAKIQIALAAYTRVAFTVDFDKAPFRPLIVPLLKHADPTIRAGALDALLSLPPDDGDLPLVISLSDDPALKQSISLALFRLSKGDLTGPAAGPILKLLETKNRGDYRDVVRGIWGARMSPALEQRIAQVARGRDEDLAYDSIYYALSTQKNKGADCVEVLIKALDHPDSTNVGGRASWGLGYGVEPAQQPAAANAMVKVLEHRADGYMRQNAARSLSQYGRAEHLPALEALAAKPGASEERKKQIGEVIASIQQREQPRKAMAPKQ